MFVRQRSPANPETLTGRSGKRGSVCSLHNNCYSTFRHQVYMSNFDAIAKSA